MPDVSPTDGLAGGADHGLGCGVEGLRVVDASVFRVVACANTNVPALMVAEKIADAILQGQ